MHLTDYRINRASVPDTNEAYEAWLYDRCTTFLTAYVHLGAQRYLRHALRACSFYVSKIDRGGMFTLKRNERDLSYDCEVLAPARRATYYALTGDEAALEASRNMAHMWRDEPLFMVPYREKQAGASGKLWTERLLGTGLEGLVYGFLLTGEAESPGRSQTIILRDRLPPHHHDRPGRARRHHQEPLPAAELLRPQRGAANSSKARTRGAPGWMVDLMINPLLRYQELTGDAQVN